MKIKFGIDPTLDRLHLGHWVILNWIKNNIEGNEVIIILGDFTATIGDPSGKSKTRNALSYEDTLSNAKKLEHQISQLIDESVTFVYNSSWLKELNIYKLMSEWTLNQIIQRRDFKDRFNNNQPISLLELVYPLLQGYDSVFLKNDLELGGSDQLFNLMIGKEMMNQEIKTFELLIGLDGENKMSKSLNNCIYLDESSLDIFSKVMAISDHLMFQWISTFQFDIDTTLHPKEVKKQLAFNILNSLNKEECRIQWEDIHENKIIKDFIKLKFDKDLTTTFFSSGKYKSKSEIKRLIGQKALKPLSLNQFKLGINYFEIEHS